MVADPHPFVDIDRQDDDEGERQVEEVAVEIHDDEGQLVLAAVPLMRFTYAASEGRKPVRSVISSAARRTVSDSPLRKKVSPGELCTVVCPEDITITDNAVIPLKERVVDEFYDPMRKIFSGKED